MKSQRWEDLGITAHTELLLLQRVAHAARCFVAFEGRTAGSEGVARVGLITRLAQGCPLLDPLGPALGSSGSGGSVGGRSPPGGGRGVDASHDP